MYFWKIDSLKEDIRNGQLPERDKFIYAFIYIILTAVGLEALSWVPIENGNSWDILNSISNVLIVTVGTFYAYQANGAAKGFDFLGRYFSISFVVTIRFLALLILMLVPVTIYYIYFFGDDEEIPSTAFDTIPYLIWYAALYWRICKYISDVKPL